jgi:hypothetical protein
MARVNVYLPDGLAEELAEVEDLPVSAVCQRALREELKAMQAIAEAGKDMERIEVDLPDRVVAFTGRWLVAPDRTETRTGEEGYDSGTYWGVALTGRGRIAVYTNHCNMDDRGHLSDYDDLDGAEADGVPRDIIALARGELLGEVPVMVLDI